MSRVLIIDDDAAMRDVLRQTFERAGFEVSLAADGEQGLAEYRRRRADVIVTDIIMPNREGIETMLEIKRADPEAKVIVISGGGRTGSADFLALAEKLGADRAYSKPLDRSAVVAAARELAGAA